MCGFLAILNGASTVDLDLPRRALTTLTHRGPDASGTWLEDGVFLGHCRLSIIDIASGAQPMCSSDKRYIIVYNGEIYNFPELRKELIEAGARFNTHSDTEIILEGYRRWGADVVRYLNGMFAFVLWDRGEQSVFAARDRLGIKPLCRTMHRGALLVSSTLEPFHVLLREDKQLDFTAVRDLMTFDYIPVPHTILKGVHKLEPGSRLRWNLHKAEPEIDRSWSPPLADDLAAVPDEFELEDLIEHCVKRQMISDVPLGAFLSGGIDSSLLVAMMARNSSGPVRTFSVAFSEGDVDESSIAQLVARQFATDHTVLKAEALGSEELLELIGRLDEPFCDPALIPTFALSEMTKRYVKVALSGDGGDEVFGGYLKYLYSENGHFRLPFSAWIPPLLRKMRWRPRGMSSLYWRTLNQHDQIQYGWVRYGDFPVFRKDLRQLINPDYHIAAEIHAYFEPWEKRAHRYGSGFDKDVLMRADLETYLSENCLVKTDRASMLASLEVRVPYLDELILDRILPLPSKKKILNGQLKALLMPIARRFLPKEVWNRPKHGFNVPVHAWLAKSWRPALEAALSWGEAEFECLNYDYLRRLHAINLAEGGIDRELWNPFVLLAWAKAHSVRI